MPPRLWHRNRNGFSSFSSVVADTGASATVERWKVMRKNVQSSSTILVHCHASLCRYADFCWFWSACPLHGIVWIRISMLEWSLGLSLPISWERISWFPSRSFTHWKFFGHAFSLHRLIKAQSVMSRSSDKAARTLPRNYKSQSWAINTSAID